MTVFHSKMKSLETHFETKILTQTNSKALIIFSEKFENIKKTLQLLDKQEVMD